VQGDVTGTVNVNNNGTIPTSDGYADLIITGSVMGATVKVGQDGDLTVGGNMNNTNL